MREEIMHYAPEWPNRPSARDSRDAAWEAMAILLLERDAPDRGEGAVLCAAERLLRERDDLQMRVGQMLAELDEETDDGR